MLPNPESHERRMKMDKAPDSLINPMVKLVQAVRARLEYCQPDYLGRRQTYVVGIDGAYYLQLTSVPLDKSAEQFSGMFVSGFVVDPDTGVLLCKLEEIQIPGREEAVNFNFLYHLRDCDPDEVEGLAEIVKAAGPLEVADFDGFNELYREALNRRVPDLDEIDNEL